MVKVPYFSKLPLGAKRMASSNRHPSEVDSATSEKLDPDSRPNLPNKFFANFRPGSGRSRNELIGADFLLPPLLPLFSSKMEGEAQWGRGRAGAPVDTPQAPPLRLGIVFANTSKPRTNGMTLRDD